jgi:hypothetical protein
MYEIQSLENEVGFKGVREIQLAQGLNFVVQLRTVNFKKNSILAS